MNKLELEQKANEVIKEINLQAMTTEEGACLACEG